MNKYETAIAEIKDHAEHNLKVKLSVVTATLAVEALEKQAPKFVGCKEWKGTRNTRYSCPNCNKNVRNGEIYCHKCGQKIKFPKIMCENNKCRLDWSGKDE